MVVLVVVVLVVVVLVVVVVVVVVTPLQCTDHYLKTKARLREKPHLISYIIEN